MNTPTPALVRHGGWALTILALLYAAVVHYGAGPAPTDPALRSWATPLGAFDDWAPRPWSRSLLLFGGVSLALSVAIFATTRSAIARTLGVAATLAVVFFVTFGIGPDQAWRLFHWRGSGVMVTVALLLAATACAPLLARAWSQQTWAARCATYLPLFLAVLALERNLTGTDPMLPLALSPWPIVPTFGLEVLGAFIAAIWLGAGLGLWAIASATSLPLAARIPIGVVLACGLPAVWLGGGGWLGLFPFEPGRALVGGVTLIGAIALGLTALVGSLGSSARRERAMAIVLGGAMAALPIALGQGLSKLDYANAREVRAQSVVDALSGWLEREGVYPETLDELVASGDMAGVPAPGIGFDWLSGQEFVYQNFGTNYLLEFSAPRWVQCAYSPPWSDLDEEDEEDFAQEDPEGDEELGGAWSCPSTPPELW